MLVGTEVPPMVRRISIVSLLAGALVGACGLISGPRAEQLAATMVAQTSTAASPTALATDTPPATSSATDPPVPPTATSTATPQPTPTLGPILVSDEFASDVGTWLDCDVCSWEDGVLVAGPWPVSGAYEQHNIVCGPCGPARHFRMAVDVTYGSGPSERGFGLMVRQTEAFLLTAEVTPHQTLDGWRYDYQNRLWELLSGELSGAVRPGRSTNRVEVEVAPAEIPGNVHVSIGVNGRNLIVLFNQPGEIGPLGLTLYGHAVEVIFDNFQFEELPPYSGWQRPQPGGLTG